MNDTERKQSAPSTVQDVDPNGSGHRHGQLLRRFWHPVALSKELVPGKAMPLKVLGEELTLFRGESGKAHMVGGRCAHRRTLLHTGWVQGEKIRCIYHGWQYDATGQCVHRPAENDSGLAAGQDPRLPRLRVLRHGLRVHGRRRGARVRPAAQARLRRQGRGRRGGRERGRPTGSSRSRTPSTPRTSASCHQALCVGPFGHAVTTAVPRSSSMSRPRPASGRSPPAPTNNVRGSDWTFPNNNHIIVPGLQPDDAWIDIGVWMTPADEHEHQPLHAVRLQAQGCRGAPAVHGALREVRHLPPGGPPRRALPGRAAAGGGLHRRPDRAQDYVAMRGQDRITDREQESSAAPTSASSRCAGSSGASCSCSAKASRRRPGTG